MDERRRRPPGERDGRTRGERSDGRTRAERSDGRARTERGDGRSQSERSRRVRRNRGGQETGVRFALGRVLQRSARARTGAGTHGERTVFGLSTGRVIVLAVVVFALALTLAMPLRNYFAQRSEAAELSAQRVELEQDLDRLRAQREQQQDPAYIRAEARERLRLVLPGETPFQVQLPGAYEAEQARRADPAPKGGPWYTDLWRTISQPQPVSADPKPAG